MANIAPYLVNSYIRQAEQGNVESARHVAGYAADFLTSGRKMPDCLRVFLIKALESVADGGAADSAFLIAKSQGRPPVTYDDKLKAYYLVEELLPNTSTVNEAFEKVGAQVYRSAETVKKHYYELKPGMDEIKRINSEER